MSQETEGTANQPILVSRGEVVRIGRLEIHGMMEKFGHESPMFSFLNIRKPNNSFVSTCIHLRIDGYGKTEEDAKNDMADNVCYFLSQNFSEFPQEEAWENITALEKPDIWANELWVAYHAMQNMRARQGKSDPVAELLSNLAQAKEQAEEWKRQAKDNAMVASIILSLVKAEEETERAGKLAEGPANVALHQVIRRTLEKARG